MRNQISAQQSRIRRKEEVIFLNKITRDKDAIFTQFVKQMALCFDNQDLMAIHSRMSRQFADIDASFYQSKAPKLARSKSKNLDYETNAPADSVPDFKGKFQQSLTDFFTTKEDLFEQFKQNDPKFEDDEF